MTILQRTKQTLTLTHEGKTVTYTHAGRGFEYIDELLCHPFQPIECAYLRQLYQTDPHAISEDDFSEMEAVTIPYCADFPFLPSELPIEAADKQTIKQVKERLLVLIDKEAELKQYHDLAALEDVRDEKDKLVEYLTTALTPLDRPRYLHHQPRNDYSAVKQAIQRAIEKLKPDFPCLVTDLTQNLEYGLSVCYKSVA
jgi:hypothetical protein